MKRSILFAAFAATAFTAQANPTVEREGMLVSKNGKTLYTFTKDAAGKSNCNGGCATAWPPFKVENPALAGGEFSIVARDDGSQQWAYKAMPLYFFAADANPGDAKGAGQGGVWFPAKAPAKSAKADSGDSEEMRNLNRY